MIVQHIGCQGYVVHQSRGPQDEFGNEIQGVDEIRYRSGHFGLVDSTHAIVSRQPNQQHE